MKRKNIFIIIGLVLVCPFLLLGNNPYYSSIYDAIRENKSYGYEIATIIQNDKPIMFYISTGKSLHISTFETKMDKNILKYRTFYSTEYDQKFDEVKLQMLANINGKLITDLKGELSMSENLDRIVFGVYNQNEQGLYLKYDLHPNFIEFKYNNKPYIFWYVIGGNELGKFGKIEKEVTIETLNERMRKMGWK